MKKSVSYYNMATVASEREKQAIYARMGLDISKMLLDATSSEHYQMSCDVFQMFLDDLLM